MLNSEQAIIARAVGGEASAFGLLYDYYQPRIYRFVLIKVGHREEAEDLTHQVFLHAWQHIGSYRHRGFPFSGWLYQIARNQIIDAYRTKKPNVPLHEMDLELFASGVSVEITTEARMELDRVHRAIRTLRPEHQDVIIMRFVEDLPIREVAASLGKSEGAIKLLQHRAMKELKNALGINE